MHTPGPWKSRKRQIRAHVWGQEMPIATVKLFINPTHPGVTQADPDTAKANARLIAAAPDLLEACRRVAEDARRHCIFGGAIEMCTEAYLKATGDKP